MQLNLLVPCGEGIAVENREAGNNYLKVHPMTTNGYVAGELSQLTDTLTASGIDSNGNHYTDTIIMGSFIICDWYPSMSSTAEPPYIRRGERIKLFRVGDSQEYYWQSLGLDTGLRRLETKTLLVSNTVDETVKELTPTNSWVIQANSHDGYILIQTNTSNGEKFAYTVRIDTKQGFVHIGDSAGNTFELVSEEQLVELANGAGCVLSLKGDTMTFKAKNVIFDTKNYTNKASQYTVKASAINLNGSLKNNGKNVGNTHRHPTPSGTSGTPF